MAQIDTYRNAVIKKREELSQLGNELAKEQSKIAPLQQKVIATENSIKRATNQSVVKSKLNEIERTNKSISEVNKKVGAIQGKIAQKEKDLTIADKNYRNEELKQNKKSADEAKKRQRETEFQTRAIEQRMRQNEQIQAQMKNDIEILKAIPNQITVLFMASNPTDTPQLRIDEEARLIHEKIRLSEYRDSVRFESRWATRSSDVLQAINVTNPTIVHFSGHGTSSGEIVLQNPDGTTKLVSKEAITAAMTTASETIRLVVFNTCFSNEQAENVVRNISAAIGMCDSIGDTAAIVFAAQLYSSIGFGRSLQTSFNQAKAALLMEGIAEDETPRLYVMDGIDPTEIVLVEPNS